MRVGHLIKLDVPPGRIRSGHDFLVDVARDKVVLNVGAAGGVDRYLPDDTAVWAHARFLKVAKQLDALDIDREGIEWAARHGYHIDFGNCETVALGKKYDAIFMEDVIEHLECPTRGITNMAAHLKPGAKVYITTPNATYISDVLRAVFNRPPHTFWDHTATHQPEHIQAIYDRHGLRLEAVFFFGEIDTRKGYGFRSAILQNLTAAFPRLSPAFLAVVAQQT